MSKLGCGRPGAYWSAGQNRELSGVSTSSTSTIRPAASRGIIIADTKFEFGTAADGALLLIDEVMTPDSSRFWPADRYAPGLSQPSFDKQPLRDYLAGLKAAGRWNGEAPPPALPAEVVEATSRRYLEAFCLITGRALEDSA